LELEANARLALTNSGGVQALRDNTERPETLEVGSNVLAGTRPERILEGVRVILDRENGWEDPFGEAGEEVVGLIRTDLNTSQTKE